MILFRQPGAQVPAELHQALLRNNSEPIEVDHALAAMGRLYGAKAAVLLLCEPQKLSGTDELLGTVERYLPRVTRWEYIPGEDPPLRPIAGASGVGVAAKPASGLEPGPRPGPRPGPERGVEPKAQQPEGRGGRHGSFALRLAEESGPNGAPKPTSTGNLLTRDEMEALFSEDSP